MAPRKTKAKVDNSLCDVLGLSSNPYETRGTQLNQTTTLFKNNRWYLISNMRQLLSEIYVEHGLVQTVIDVPVDDGMRGGVEIKSKELDPDDIEVLNAEMERDNDLGNIGQAIKWNRLYGGAGVIIILSDQDPTTELDMDAITPDTGMELRAVDMWELYGDQQNLNSDTSITQLKKQEVYTYYGQKIHASRVMLMRGIVAPSFVRPRLRGWGVSICETLVNSINQYLKTNNLIFEVLDEFKVDVYKIKNLTNSLLSSTGATALKNRIQLANMQKNYQNAITMDGEDDFLQRELTFTGIAETMQGIRMQVASDMRMPLSKIFGIGSTGFSSGEDDIENYNSMIESQIRQKAKYDIIKVIKLRCQKNFGFIPEDLQISFRPLRMLSAEQEENVKSQKFTRLMSALQVGAISPSEFKDSCNKDNLLGIQVDTSNDELDPVVPDGNETGEYPKAPAGKKSTIKAKEAKT